MAFETIYGLIGCFFMEPSTSHTRRIVHDWIQVIDGEFSAYESSDSQWVIVRAVDSAFYEVFSTESAVLDRVRESFRKVSDCDYVAE